MRLKRSLQQKEKTAEKPAERRSHENQSTEGFGQTKDKDIAFRKVENRTNFEHAKFEMQN